MLSRLVGSSCRALTVLLIQIDVLISSSNVCVLVVGPFREIKII